MDLKARVLEGELMDAPDLEAARHVQALEGLQRVNLLSGTASVLARAILKHFAERPTLAATKAQVNRPAEQSYPKVRILDLACGGGDVTLSVCQRLSAAGLAVQVEGWDRSATAVEYANRRASRAAESGSEKGVGPVRFLRREVQDLESVNDFDVVMCSLFMHHLNRDVATDCLSRMYRAARHLVLVDDLRRTRLGYCLAQLGCRLLTRSPIVHVDGPLSVRAAFTEEELRTLGEQAGLPQPTAVRHWPQRFLMTWKRAA